MRASDGDDATRAAARQLKSTATSRDEEPAPRRPLFPHRALLPELRRIRDPILLRRQLHWLLAIRLVVVSSVALLYFLLSLLPVDALRALNPRFLFLAVGLTYAASLLYIVGLQVVPRREALHAYVQFVGDLLLITALVFWFGGIHSPFSMLYLVVISIAAALLRRTNGVMVANLAYVLYAGTALSLFYGWVAPPTDLGFDPTSLPRLVYNLSMHLLAFYGVALLTSYLARDVSRAERELDEKAGDLADLQVVYHDVVQSMSSGLLTTDPEGAVTAINRLGEQLLQQTPEELVGRHIATAGLLDDDAWRRIASVCSEGGKVREETAVELADESSIFGYTATPLADAHGQSKGLIVVFQDLTEWRKMEEEVRIKDRMAVVGELAAGIAHEIGNPLAAISGSVQMLIPTAREDPSRQKLLEILLRESKRLDRTVKSFLQFARPAERASVHFDIAALLAEHVELLRNSEELTEQHTVHLDLDPPSATVVADPDQISQIFWNLIRNALRAMPLGGTLRVTGRLVGSHFRLEVRDTGRGMSKEERSKLFQPFKSFFGKGSGIGMAIVYRIVQEHEGRMMVDSAPGLGTTITIVLPIAGTAATRPAGEAVG